MNPFDLYHGLGPGGIPWGGGDPVVPARPERVQKLIYGFAMAAQEEAIAYAQAGAGSR